jgi:DNA-binding NarL/FixJ family response regulator
MNTPLRVHVNATDGTARSGMLALLDRAGVALASEPDGAPDIVMLAAARTVDEALEACHPGRAGGHRTVVVADTFSPNGVLRALREGVSTMLRSAATTPRQLRAALHAARDGDGRIPHDLLVRLLRGGVAAAPAPLTVPTRLTARQLAVLRLMADGLGNAAIASSLSCSEHTVKNVIYELMARLHARNRAHAVAAAVRAGLI